MFPLILALTLAPAHAADGTPAWGVGPVVDTIVLPGQYPVKFSPDASDAGGFEKLRGDLGIGVRGIARPWDNDRFGARARLGLGAEGYRNATFTFEYDHYLFDKGGVYGLGGGGIGVGAQSFGSSTGEKLSMTTYLVRAQTGVGYAVSKGGGELSLVGTLVIPGVQNLVAADGTKDEVGGGFYGHLGVELSALFGQLEP